MGGEVMIFALTPPRQLATYHPPGGRASGGSSLINPEGGGHVLGFEASVQCWVIEKGSARRCSASRARANLSPERRLNRLITDQTLRESSVETQDSSDGMSNFGAAR